MLEIINCEELENRIENIVRDCINRSGIIEAAIRSANLTEQEAAYIGSKPAFDFFLYGDYNALRDWQEENQDV